MATSIHLELKMILKAQIGFEASTDIGCVASSGLLGSQSSQR